METTTCLICLGTLPTDEARLSPLKCRHPFCAECVAPWLDRYRKCPLPFCASASDVEQQQHGVRSVHVYASSQTTVSFEEDVYVERVDGPSHVEAFVEYSCGVLVGSVARGSKVLVFRRENGSGATENVITPYQHVLILRQFYDGHGGDSPLSIDNQNGNDDGERAGVRDVSLGIAVRINRALGAVKLAEPAECRVRAPAFVVARRTLSAAAATGDRDNGGVFVRAGTPIVLRSGSAQQDGDYGANGGGEMRIFYRRQIQASDAGDTVPRGVDNDSDNTNSSSDVEE